MNVLQQLENAPKNIVLYFVSLLGAVVDDYALLTLTIFCTLLGFVVGSVLIPATAFFGLYFLMRIVISMRLAADAASRQQSQAMMQVAAAIAQFHPPQGVLLDPDEELLP